MEIPNDAPQRVAVRPQFLRSPNLIRFVLSQYGKNEDTLELAHRLGIPDAAPVHLKHKLQAFAAEAPLSAF